MSKIIVTGATGELGKLVVQHLLNKVPANQVAVSVRDIQKANSFTEKDIEVRYGDYNDSASLEEAFSGASKLLLISTSGGDSVVRIRQHVNAIEAAKRAGVKHIIYTSFAAVDKGAFPLLGNVHLATEYTLQASDIPTTILRNAFYQEVFVNEGLQSFVESGTIVTSAGRGKINTVQRNDLALAAAAVLAQDGHENKVYELASSEAWGYDELATILTDVTGKQVTHTPVSEAEAFDAMVQAGIPEGAAHFQTALFNSIAKGNEGNTSTDLEKLIGRKPTSIREAVTKFFNK